MSNACWVSVPVEPKAHCSLRLLLSIQPNTKTAWTDHCCKMACTAQMNLCQGLGSGSTSTVQAASLCLYIALEKSKEEPFILAAGGHQDVCSHLGAFSTAWW